MKMWCSKHYIHTIYMCRGAVGAKTTIRSALFHWTTIQTLMMIVSLCIGIVMKLKCEYKCARRIDVARRSGREK